ncbi:MAG: hypothetical protein R2813_02895 [Flavobacteriales bacterium]
MKRVKLLHNEKQQKVEPEKLLGDWEKDRQRKATYCFAKGCLQTKGLRAYIVKLTADDTHEMIVPLCSRHAKTSGSFELEDY